MRDGLKNVNDNACEGGDGHGDQIYQLTEILETVK